MAKAGRGGAHKRAADARARESRASTDARARRLRAALRGLYRDPWLLAALCLWLLRWLAPHIWLAALIAELSFQLALVTLALAGAFALRRVPLRAVLLLLFALLFLSDSWPYWRASRPTPEHGPTLRVAQAHLAGARLSSARLAAWLVRERVDLASLTGLAAEDASVLRAQQIGYGRLPQVESPTSQLWAKRPLLVPGRDALQLGRCQLPIVQVDLPTLFSPSSLPERRREIAQLARAERETRRLYVGQLGSSSQAADLAPLHRARELRDARLGHGRLATACDWLGPLGFALDHVLLHGWILARTAATSEPVVAGAHRTFLATIELTEPRCRPRATP